MTSEEIPNEMGVHIEDAQRDRPLYVSTQRPQDATLRSAAAPCRADAQNGKIMEELRNHASILESCLSKFLECRHDVVDQLQLNQRNLIRIMESMAFSEPESPFASRGAGSAPGVLQVSTPEEPGTNRISVFTGAFSESSYQGAMPMENRPLSMSHEESLDYDNERSSVCTPNPLRASTPSAWKGLIPKQRTSLFDHETLYIQREYYQICLGLLIIANAAYVGWEVQYAAENPGSELDGHRGGAIVFLIAYFLHVVLCLYYQRDSFFDVYVDPWHAIDGIVFAIMLFEEILRLVDFFDSLFVLRMQRLFRSLRVLHVLRLFRHFQHFQRLLPVVGNCIVAMFFLLVVCSLYIYTFALAIAQESLEHCAARQERVDISCDTFGKLSDAALSLFMAMFGGTPWADLYNRSKTFGMIFSMIFVIFISFSSIVIVNVITGVVLDIHQEIKHSQTDHAAKLLKEKKILAKEMMDVFHTLDINVSGGISLEELKYATRDERMCALIESMGFDVADIDELFDLLDKNKAGCINVEEFVLGGLRMYGTAKASELMKLKILVQGLQDMMQSEDRSGKCRGGSGEPFRPSVSSAASVAQSPTQTHEERLEDIRKELGGHWQVIDDVEMRAMRMRDLKAVRTFVFRQCSKAKWIDLNTGKKLNPYAVNLYHFNYYVISPVSAPEGVILKGIQHGQIPPGAEVAQGSQSNDSAQRTAVGVVQDVSPRGSVHVKVICGSFQKCDEFDDSQYRIYVSNTDAGVPDEVEVPIALSYKEAFHPTPTKPMWFCSHWWGEPIYDFVACCEHHAMVRAVGLDTSFWICAYANRQSELADDISNDPDSSSFRRAMHATEGTLLILDKASTPFRRIWCDFELYHTISDNKLLDIVTICDAGGQRAPQLLAQGLLAGETMLSKTRREAKFPIKALLAGMHSRLEDGTASVLADKDQILRCIGKDRVTGRAGDEVATALALQRTNNTLHSYLALAAWPQALMNRGNCEQMSPHGLGLPYLIKRDEDMKVLHMNFAHLQELNDIELKEVANCFPPGLHSLQISFEGCSNITDEGMTTIGRRIPTGLQTLVLDFVGCKNISDDGLASLASRLPQDLRELRLDFALCSRIGLPGIRILENNLPLTLVHFAATFQGTEVNRKFESVQELHKFCKANKEADWAESSSIRTKRSCQERTWTQHFSMLR